MHIKENMIPELNTSVAMAGSNDDVETIGVWIAIGIAVGIAIAL